MNTKLTKQEPLYLDLGQTKSKIERIKAELKDAYMEQVKIEVEIENTQDEFTEILL